jgi:O-antigen/teichoic acid export membrane protein
VIRQKFLGDAFAQNVVKLAGGAAIGQVLTLGASPILSRLYAPDDFGVLGVFASITSIATMFAALRYEQAIPLAESDDEAKDVAILSCCVLVTLCVISFGFLSYTAWMGYSLIDGLSTGFMLLLPLSVFAGSMYRILVNLTIRAKNYDPIATTKLYQSIGQVAVQLCAGFWRPHPLGLIAGFMVSQGGGSLTLFAKNKQKGSLLKNVSVASVRFVAKKYKEFPMILSWAILLNSASMHLPGILIAKYYGIGAAGLFYLSRRVLGAPMILLRTSVSQVFLGEASSLYREDPVKLKALFHSTSRKLLQMGSLVCIPAAVVSPYLFPLVFGPNWAMAGKITQILALFQLCQFTVGPLMQVLLIIGMRKAQLVVDVIRFLVVVLSFYITSFSNKGVLFALIVYVSAASIYYGLNYFYISTLLSRASLHENRS